MPSSLAYLSSFFGEGLEDTDRPDYSHAVRWRNTRRGQRFFSAELQAGLARQSLADEHSIAYPPGFDEWHPLSKAQWLESAIFLPQYLLSSQGDRPGMANSTEGRYPFLDYRVVEFCNRLPPDLKLRGLTEKYLLRRLASKWLPDEIWKRRKRPYRAPIHRSFFNAERAEWVMEVLSPETLQAAGLFNPGAVGQLVQKLEAGKRLGETDDMALAGILSAQLLYKQFVAGFQQGSPVTDGEIRKRCLGDIYELQLEPSQH